ncbi:Flagellar hook protein FlgE [hydrothermal vent metagenome]|uniref:Flagellar hook protein FlgE n=1 Tax=hydrothermal vent metagenome TaxID=652676 RepID=A0A3B0SBB5_9ZZZZ
MGLSSSLNAGVMGLSVNATKLGTISNNIANSQTFGYKRADTEFADMVLAQTRGNFAAGGVRAITFREAGAQGALITTSNSMDISISGRGMLPVTDVSGLSTAASDRPMMLTSTGSFSTDDSGFLRTLSGLHLLGWPADTAGNVGAQPRDSVAGLEPVRVNLNQFAASPTSNIQLGLNLPASETQNGASGAALNLPIEYFDSLGRSQTLNMVFTPVVPATGASNEWNVDIFDNAGDPLVPVGTFNVTFDASATGGGSVATVTPAGGATYNAGTGAVSVAVASGAIDIVVGSAGQTSPLTQLSASFAPLAISKDGAPIGNLNSLEIDESGFLQAIFDTGFRRTIYQIPIANVPNFKGLNAEGNQAFSVSQESGDFFLWDAGDGPVGTTIGFSLTESTTDIANELTDLIQTQRAYSSNAKIIQTVDEILQETTDIIR